MLRRTWLPIGNSRSHTIEHPCIERFLRARNKMTVEGLAVFRHVMEHTGIHGGTNARNGFKMALRRPLGANQPTAAQAATSANTLSGPQAPERPPRAHRHHLRATHRHPVAGDARRAGVWLRDDLSSSAQAVAPERCVPEALRGAVGGAQRRR